MKIRKIQNIVMSSLLVAGLAGCSNSSSVSQSDGGSPWKSKRNAEAANATSAEFVEVSLDEAVLVNDMEAAPVIEEPMAGPEMEAQPQFESISDFNPEPVPAESMMTQAEPEMAVVVGSDIMSAPSSAYAVQVYAGRKLANVNRYISAHGLDNMQVVKTERDGDVIYVLVSIHADRETAIQVMNDLEQSTGSKPWVRPVGGLKGIVAQ